MVDGDVLSVYANWCVPFNVIAVTLRECCAPQGVVSVDLGPDE